MITTAWAASPSSSCSRRGRSGRRGSPTAVGVALAVLDELLLVPGLVDAGDDVGRHRRTVRDGWVGATDGRHRHPRLARADRPQRAAGRHARGRGGGLRARLVLRPLLAVERAPGRVGFAWSWLGAAMQATCAAVRRRQRARPALPPGDRRPGGGHAGRAVPRAAVGRARHGRVLQRAHHRRAVAGQDGPQRPAARVRRRHPRAVRGRGRRPRRARQRRPREAVDAPGRAAAAARHRGERGDGGLGRRVGRRADHDRPAARAPGADARRLPRAAARASRSRSRSTSPGRRTRTRRCAHRPRPVAHQRLPAAAVLGSRDGRAVRRAPPSTCGPEDLDGAGARSPPTSRATARGSRS